MTFSNSVTPAYDERQRVLAIQGLGKKLNIPTHIVDQAVRDGDTIQDFNASAIRWIEKSPPKPIGAMSPNNHLGLDKKDIKQYSLARAMSAPHWELKGLEKECHDALFSKMSIEQRGKIRGLLVPIADLNWGSKRNTLNTANYAKGGALTETVLDGSRYIDALQEKSLVMSMGVTTIPDCSADLALPKMLEQSQVSWVGENQEISDTNPSFGRVEFSLKSVAAIATYSRNLLIQSAGVVALENVIKSDLVRCVAQAIDRACIFGNPATNPNEPLGIFNNPECQEITPTAPTGDDFDYELLVEMERQLFQKNAYGDGSALGYLTNANIRAKAKTKTENDSNISQWIWQAGGESLEFGRMNGYRAGCTSAMPSNFGDEEDLNGIIFGDWSALYIALFGQLEILVNPFGNGNFPVGATSVRVIQSVDCNVRHGESFVYSKSLL